MTDNLITVGYYSSAGSSTALRWALDEAGRTGAGVRLVYVVGSPVPPSGSMMPVAASWPYEDLGADVDRLLTDASTAAARSHPGVRVTTEMATGGPVPVLLPRSAGSRLLVVGSRGHGGFAGLLLGSVGTAVSAHAHCPVVVVRPDNPPPRAAAHVVVGVDGSPCSQLALGFAFEVAVNRQVGLHVVRAVAPAAGSVPESTRAAELTAGDEAELARAVSAWQDKFPGVTATTEVLVDTPAAVLIRTSRHAQLVVVGSRGLGGFRGMLLGSVSQQLLHHGHCPVAVVREMPGPHAVTADR